MKLIEELLEGVEKKVHAGEWIRIDTVRKLLGQAIKRTKLQDGEQMNDEEQECHECGREWTRNNGRGCPYNDPTCFVCEKHDHGDCDYPSGDEEE